MFSSHSSPILTRISITCIYYNKMHLITHLLLLLLLWSCDGVHDWSHHDRQLAPNLESQTRRKVVTSTRIVHYTETILTISKIYIQTSSTLNISGFVPFLWFSDPHFSIQQILHHACASPSISVTRLIPVPKCPTACDARERSPAPPKYNFMLCIKEVAFQWAIGKPGRYQNNQGRH